MLGGWLGDGVLPGAWTPVSNLEGWLDGGLEGGLVGGLVGGMGDGGVLPDTWTPVSHLEGGPPLFLASAVHGSSRGARAMLRKTQVI